MKKFCVAISFVLTASACEDKTSSSLKENTPQRVIETLGASDVSILVPLQNSIFDDLNDSDFGKKGTGMCNAPTLDLGGDDPILSSALWQEWAKDSLMSVLPLPVNAAAWKEEAIGAGLGDLQDSLKTAMSALPDVDTVSDDLCPEPIGGQELRTDDVELLRNEGTNVAVTQSLPAGACHYKNWRVVAARFEPCSFRTTIVKQQTNGLNPAQVPAFPTEACGGAELRLVLQPFIANGDGGYTAIDMAVHAFYKIEDVRAFVDDLRSLRSVSQSVLTSNTANDKTSVWYADQKDMFLPHPGLREEMDCESGIDNPGVVGQEWRRLLSAYAKQSRLFKLTWMTSDNSGGNWSFGVRLVEPVDEYDVLRHVTRQETFKVETFTLSQLSRGFPFTPFDLSLKTVDYFYRAGRTETQFTSDESKSALRELMDLADPDHTSLNLGGKDGGSCASCHTRDITEKAVRQRTGKTHEELATLAGTTAASFPMWPPIRKGVEKRNENNVRNFGYGPAMTLGVNRRALNETDAVRRLVNDYFGSADPVVSGDPMSLGVEPSSLPLPLPLPLPSPLATPVSQAPIVFETDIKPLIASRCGACHSSKRSPILVKERTAQIYSAAIVRNVCSAPLSFQHMPPGKVLPRDEKALILRWANSLYPDAEPLTCVETPAPAH